MTTGLDQAMVEWWSDTDSLTALVPVDRVDSEIRQSDEYVLDDSDGDGVFDDCVVFQIASEPHWRTNSTQGWRSAVKLSALSADYTRSKTIAQAIATAWNNATFTGSGSAITLSRMTGIAPTQDDTTGIWDHTISFDMNHSGV